MRRLIHVVPTLCDTIVFSRSDGPMDAVTDCWLPATEGECFVGEDGIVEVPGGVGIGGNRFENPPHRIRLVFRTEVDDRADPQGGLQHYLRFRDLDPIKALMVIPQP